MSGSFEAVLEEYLQRMKAREPFVMYRFGDGELMLADGVAVGPNTQASRVDLWEAPNQLTALGWDLRTVLATQEHWAHFGIPCPCCNMNGFERLRREIRHAPVFPANLFINANYPRFRHFLQELGDLPVALVMNKRGSTGRMPFPVAQCMRVPDNCVLYYEHNRLELLAQARDFSRSLNRTLVLVSAGPLSEALIFVMWNTNPNNTYVDVGSALDELSYGQKTRAYMIEGNAYATRSCPLPAITTNKAPMKPRVSLIINTACGDPIIGERRNLYRSATYQQRIDLLATQVLPRVQGFDEVIIAGVFPKLLTEQFPDFRFVHVPAQRHDRWDALAQRETGARWATGDILVFCHDDHAPGETLADYLRSMPPTTDILVPKRVHLKNGASMNNGRADGYMGGHCYAMRRWIWASIPLTTAPDEFWDIYLTPLWRTAGASIVWTDDACHYDCEALEGEL